MNTTITIMLDDQQRLLSEALAAECCRYDGITLSYPAAEATQHILLFDEEEHLVSILGLVSLAKSLIECSAFTLPAFRRRGYFSQLFTAALEQFEECDILFAVDESCTDTMAVLQALEAELDSREHLMERRIGDLLPERTIHPENTLTLQESDGQWVLFYRHTPIGQCETTPISKGGICLHHVLIDNNLHGQGFGYDFMVLLLRYLAKQSITDVLLQVSEQNTAAMKLYQKTGFRITGTLSYYYY